MTLAEGATIDPLQLLMVNAGVAGVVVVLILVGWLWAKPSVTREFEKSDERDTQKQALIDSLLTSQKDVLPLLVEVDKRLIPLMDATQAMLKRVEALLDRIEREWEWRERRGRASEETGGRPGRDYEDRRGGGSGQGPGRRDPLSDEEGSR